MKNLFKMTAVAVLVIALMSCDLGQDENDKAKGIDWASYTTNGAFGIRNNTSERLIAFKNSVAASNLLGGVDSGEQGHYFKRDPKLFTKTEDFPLILITEAQYKTNKGNLNSLNNTPFTRIYVFYNHDLQAERILYEISGNLGGAAKLLVQNSSNYNIELRVHGVGGETIGYAPKELGNVTLQLAPEALDIYPVIKYFHPTRGTVSTIFPKNVFNTAYFQSYDFSDTSKTWTFDASDFLSIMGEMTKTIGASWIKIDNQSAGAIQLQMGGALYTNPTTGSRYVNSQSILTYQVDMPDTAGAYATSRELSNMKVGVTGIMVDIKTKNGGETTFTIETDKQYTVTVTGNSQLGTLAATIDIEGAIAVEFDGFAAQ